MALDFMGVEVRAIRLGTTGLALSGQACLVVAVVAEVAFVGVAGCVGASDGAVSGAVGDRLVDGFVVSDGVTSEPRPWVREVYRDIDAK